MSGPAYPPARKVAAAVQGHFERRLAAVRAKGHGGLATVPDAATIEAIIDAAFWASLRREEGYWPKISLAFLSPEEAARPLKLERRLPLEPAALARLAPAVERPGIHLGVWRDRGGLFMWGTTRTIPRLCFVLEVVEPGLLVVKYRRAKEHGKYVNVAALKGDQIKVVDESGASLPDCPAPITSMLGFGSPSSANSDAVDVLVQLAASMRAHGRGGSLLVVPHGTEGWRESIMRHVNYPVVPPFTELSDLMRADASERDQQAWQEAMIDAVEAMAGLTAVDGAALITDRYDLLAFGAKIVQREGRPPVEQIILTEPVVGDTATVSDPSQLGGTRHISAAQFVQDQPGSVALVASQDGRFTVFRWSVTEDMVRAHRVEALLM